MEEKNRQRIAAYTEGLLAQMVSGKPYVHEVLDKDWIILPGVFSPRYYVDPEVFTPTVVNVVGGGSLWEVGCGPAITAIECALNGSPIVRATDINPAAVKNARINATYHDAYAMLYNPSGGIYEADIFGDGSNRSERFKIIYWNHPWNGWESPNGRTEMIMRAGFDPDYAKAKEFIRHGAAHLTPGGSILLATSTIADWEMLLNFGSNLGYQADVIMDKAGPMEPGGGSPELDFELRFKLLRFRP